MIYVRTVVEVIIMYDTCFFSLLPGYVVMWCGVLCYYTQGVTGRVQAERGKLLMA